MLTLYVGTADEKQILRAAYPIAFPRRGPKLAALRMTLQLDAAGWHP